jgi:hypothetical protein
MISDNDRITCWATTQGIPMTERIKIRVFRNFDNRHDNLPDDSPRALELHQRRSASLHDIVDRSPYWKVVDWRKTDDEEAHEVIEIVLEALSNPTVVKGAKCMGGFAYGRRFRNCDRRRQVAI